MSGTRCKRCNRRLKSPEAIEVGFGSACYKQLFGKSLKTTKGRRSSNGNTQNVCEEQQIEGQLSCLDESEV